SQPVWRPHSGQQQLIVAGAVSMVDSFRLLGMRRLRTQSLALQYCHELAFQRIQMAAAHACVAAHAIKTYVAVDRIWNHAEHPDIKGMKVQAQTFRRNGGS